MHGASRVPGGWFSRRTQKPMDAGAWQSPAQAEGRNIRLKLGGWSPA